MNDTRALFERVLTDEPPLGVSLGPVVIHGKRVRRRRRLAAVAGITAVIALGSLLAIPLANGVRDTPPTSGGSRIPAGLTPLQRTVAEALVDASPSAFVYDLSPERWSDEGLVTTVDDGQGRTRFVVRLWPLYRHECALVFDNGECSDTYTPKLAPDASIAGSDEIAPGAVSELMTNGIENGPAVQVEATTYLPDKGDPRHPHVVRAQPPVTGGRLSFIAAQVSFAYRTFLARQGAQPAESGTGGEAQRGDGTP